MAKLALLILVSMRGQFRMIFNGLLLWGRSRWRGCSITSVGSKYFLDVLFFEESLFFGEVVNLPMFMPIFGQLLQVGEQLRGLRLLHLDKFGVASLLLNGQLAFLRLARSQNISFLYTSIFIIFFIVCILITMFRPLHDIFNFFVTALPALSPHRFMLLVGFIIGVVEFCCEPVYEGVALFYILPSRIILFSLFLIDFIILISMSSETLPAESTVFHQLGGVVEPILVRCSKSIVSSAFVGLQHVYYQFLLTLASPMQRQTTCYLCSSTSDVIEMQEDEGMCRKCYDQQGETAALERSARTELYPSLDEIDEGIFLGNEAAARSLPLLQMHAITAISVCGDHLLTPFIENPDYTYKIYPIGDFPKQRISPYFQNHYDWIESMKQHKRRILIHCAGGVSRSASFAIAYIMRQKRLPLQQAHHYVRSIRHCIRPNAGFMQQLLELESSLALA